MTRFHIVFILAATTPQMKMLRIDANASLFCEAVGFTSRIFFHGWIGFSPTLLGPISRKSRELFGLGNLFFVCEI